MRTIKYVNNISNSCSSDLYNKPELFTAMP